MALETVTLVLHPCDSETLRYARDEALDGVDWSKVADVFVCLGQKWYDQTTGDYFQPSASQLRNQVSTWLDDLIASPRVIASREGGCFRLTKAWYRLAIDFVPLQSGIHDKVYGEIAAYYSREELVARLQELTVEVNGELFCSVVDVPSDLARKYLLHGNYVIVRIDGHYATLFEVLCQSRYRRHSPSMPASTAPLASGLANWLNDHDVPHDTIVTHAALRNLLREYAARFAVQE